MSQNTRRDILKKGLVAGAVAWGVPTIVSSPAALASDACSGSKPCVNYYQAKFDASGTCSGTENPTKFCSTMSPDPCGTSPTFANGCSQNPQATWSGNTVNFTFPPGVVPLLVCSKAGSGADQIEGYPHPPSSGSWTTSQTSGISHIVLYWCTP